MTAPCTAVYANAAAIAAPVFDGLMACPPELANLFETMPCSQSQPLADVARKRMDEKLLCQLFCCCLRTGGKQTCVENALTTADAQANHHARYKAEVSFNMQFDPPRPMMEKDQGGALTTIPIPRGQYGHLTNRADIEYQEDLRRPSGINGFRYRRPDVVVVKNPMLPPERDNISQVIEMKFPGDPVDLEQNTDYSRIGGKSKFRLFRQNDPCACRENQPQTGPETAYTEVPAVQPLQRPERSAGDWVALVGLGVATVGLALLPLDGPAGETVAASALLAHWSSMFGAS